MMYNLQEPNNCSGHLSDKYLGSVGLKLMELLGLVLHTYPTHYIKLKYQITIIFI
jgi:hypothetical protein